MRITRLTLFLCLAALLAAARVSAQVPASATIVRDAFNKPMGNTIFLANATGNRTVDTTNINSAISQVAGGGVIYAGSGIYALSGPVTIASGVSLVGVKPTVTHHQPPDSGLYNAGGTWFDCNGGLCFTGNAITSVSFRDFGVINFTKGFSFGAPGVDGISVSDAENVICSGSLDSDVCWELYNFQHFNTDRLYAFQVNTGFHMISDVAWGPFNSTWKDFFALTNKKSGDNASKPDLWIEVPKGAGTLRFSGLQANNAGGDGTNVHLLVDGTGGGYLVASMFEGLDLEGPALCGVKFMGRVTENFVSLLGVQGNASICLGSETSYNTVLSYLEGHTASDEGVNNNFLGTWSSNQQNLNGFFGEGSHQIANAYDVTASNNIQALSQLNIGATTSPNNSSGIHQDATGELRLFNSAGGADFSVYTTYDTTNYNRFHAYWNGDYYLSLENGGVNTLRSLHLKSSGGLELDAGPSKWYLQGPGNWLTGSDGQGELGQQTSGRFNKIHSVLGYSARGQMGYTGTKTAGSCTFTIMGGIITNVSGC